MISIDSLNSRSIANIHVGQVGRERGFVKMNNPDWATVGFLLSREQIYQKLEEKEFRYNCVYILVGTDDHRKIQNVYVGQQRIRNNGRSIIERLKDHHANKDEKYSNKWQWVLIFTSKLGDWTTGDISALEYILYNLFPAQLLLNSNTPNYAGLNLNKYYDKTMQIVQLLKSVGFEIQDYSTGKENRLEKSTEADQKVLESDEKVCKTQNPEEISSISNEEVARILNSITVADIARTSGKFQLYPQKRDGSWHFSLYYKKSQGERCHIEVNRAMKDNTLKRGLELVMQNRVICNVQMPNDAEYAKYILHQRKLS